MKKLPLLAFLLFISLSSCALPAASAYTGAVNILVDANCTEGTLAGSSVTLTDAAGKSTQISGPYKVTDGGGFINIGSDTLTLPVTASSPAPIAWMAANYGGTITFKAAAGGFSVCNAIDLEQYIRGVVRTEMGSSWPLEALKAQAVLARTFIANAAASRAGYQIKGSGQQPSYVAARTSARIDAAVSATAGMVLLWQGRIAQVYYHADSGGMVASAADVWGKEIPYLHAEPEPFPYNGPDTAWQVSMPMSQVESKLAAGGVNIGPVASITPVKRDATGRVLSLQINGSLGSRTISGQKFRSLMGSNKVKSTLFEFGGQSAYAPLTGKSVSTQAKTQNSAAGALRKTDITGMPKNKDDQLEWLTKNKIFTTRELMDMLSKPDKIDSYIQKGIARAEGREPMPSYAPVQQTAMPQTSYSFSSPALSMTSGTGDVLTIYGRGYGHGVGLSQWGAKTMAEHGWDYMKILGYYFPGTMIGQ